MLHYTQTITFIELRRTESNGDISGSYGVSYEYTVFWDVATCNLINVYKHFRVIIDSLPVKSLLLLLVQRVTYEECPKTRVSTSGPNS